MIAPVQRHSRVGSPENPHGHGFNAASKMKLAGNDSVMVLRASVTERSSSGCRSSSRTLRAKFRQFVEKQDAMMRQAHFARPRHARAAAEQARVRHRVMRRAKRPATAIRPLPFGSIPATLWICVVSIAS